jgi:hypothetical protein
VLLHVCPSAQQSNVLLAKQYIGLLAKHYIALLSPYITDNDTELQLVFLFEIQRLMHERDFPKGMVMVYSDAPDCVCVCVCVV